MYDTITICNTNIPYELNVIMQEIFSIIKTNLQGFPVQVLAHRYLEKLYTIHDKLILATYKIKVFSKSS